MPAMVGVATEVPPNPVHVFGEPAVQVAAPPEVWVGSDQQITW